MAEQHAVPAPQSEKRQGDKLDHVLDSVLEKGSGVTQDTAGKGTEPTPQDKPLK